MSACSPVDSWKLLYQNLLISPGHSPDLPLVTSKQGIPHPSTPEICGPGGYRQHVLHTSSSPVPTHHRLTEYSPSNAAVLSLQLVKFHTNSSMTASGALLVSVRPLRKQRHARAETRSAASRWRVVVAAQQLVCPVRDASYSPGSRRSYEAQD